MRVKDYDIAVVGGGIHGVGVAQEAAARGHSVLLIEKKGLAAGTSGVSSKLIHGGLRYLERFEFSLVRECLREREDLLRIAPDLVKLKPFHFPIYKGIGRPAWQIGAGLSLYWILGGMTKHSSFGRIPKNEWPEMDGIRTEGLKEFFRYYDAQTDDALLTKAVMNSAEALGAELSMPATFKRGELTPDGIEVSYTDRGGEKTAFAKVLVNAAGPWINGVNAHIHPLTRGVKVDFVQGSHIIIDGKLEKGMYFLEAPADKRMVFALQWGEDTMVGTTETMFEGDPDYVKPLDEEIDYLSKVVVHYFPRYEKSLRKGIKSAFTGLRVLPASEANPFRRSRETILHTDRQKNPRTIAIYGGKLTAFRATARKVMDRIESSLPKHERKADTGKITLTPP